MPIMHLRWADELGKLRFTNTSYRPFTETKKRIKTGDLKYFY